MPLILKNILSIAGCPNRWALYHSVIFLFLPILTVGGVYSVNSTEMMSGLGIISEHIQFANLLFYCHGSLCSFPISVGVCAAGEDDVYCRVCVHVYIQLYLMQRQTSVFLLALCSLLTGFLRMVLMRVNLFTLIWYAGGMEATRNITPGLEPKDTAGWNKIGH